MAATVATVEVPVELLIEAAGFLDALDTLAERIELDLHAEPPSDCAWRAGRAMELVTALVLCVPDYAAISDLDDSEADAAYDAHPVERGVAAHSKRVVAAFEQASDNILSVLLEAAA